jgi:hypothetical protein
LATRFCPEEKTHHREVKRHMQETDFIYAKQGSWLIDPLHIFAVIEAIDRNKAALNLDGREFTVTLDHEREGKNVYLIKPVRGFVPRGYVVKDELQLRLERM